MLEPKKMERLKQTLKANGDAMRRFYTMDTRERQNVLDRIVDVGEVMNKREDER